MSHRHSFNTRPRVRARQKAALERWEERIKHCTKMINESDNPIHWGTESAFSREQRDILKSKLGY